MRKVVTVSIALALTFSLTGCGAGKTAATSMIKQVTDGVEGSILTDGNDVRVSGLLLVAQPDGRAVLVGSMVNGADTPEDLLAVAAGEVVGVLSATTLPMLQNKPLYFEGDSANAKVIFPTITAKPGERIKVKLFFSHAGELNLDALVREQDGIYAGVNA
jgi:hypothetical protein